MYHGLSLRPQAGLVPLGPDPETKLMEFYHLESGDPEPPARDDAGKLRLHDQSGIVFVLLPGGRVRMGAQPDDPLAPGYDEAALAVDGPVHEVELAPFFLARHELTKHQWLHISGEHDPSALPAGAVHGTGEVTTCRNPVESLSWQRARRALHSRGLLIPTEAQWEYGYQGGCLERWHWGEELQGASRHANIADRAARSHLLRTVCDPRIHDGFVHHAPVGSLQPNGFGLHDMAGNVEEWCEDVSSPFAYRVAPRARDGLREIMDLNIRVVRGGNYTSPPEDCSRFFRHWERDGSARSTLGVRAARAIQ